MYTWTSIVVDIYIIIGRVNQVYTVIGRANPEMKNLFKFPITLGHHYNIVSRMWTWIAAYENI